LEEVGAAGEGKNWGELISKWEKRPLLKGLNGFGGDPRKKKAALLKFKETKKLGAPSRKPSFRGKKKNPGG